MRLIIVDYGMGNIHSVHKVAAKTCSAIKVSSDPGDILSGDKIILPGVGHFGKAMENLSRTGLKDALNEAVLVKKTPVLGICLGMQLMALRSEEGDTDGLGWFDAEVTRFQIKDSIHYKIPHTGWNRALIRKKSNMMHELPIDPEFYFVHSYHIVSHNADDVLCTTQYEYEFVSAIEKDHISGVQFHPEKSHKTGEKLLSNFIHG